MPKATEARKFTDHTVKNAFKACLMIKFALPYRSIDPQDDVGRS
jgi:hypothetical protein